MTLAFDFSAHLDPDDDAFWSGVPAKLVRLESMVLSQTSVGIRELLGDVEDRRPAYGIRLGDGRVRLVNGHHRYARAALQGRPWLLVRVVEQ